LRGLIETNSLWFPIRNDFKAPRRPGTASSLQPSSAARCDTGYRRAPASVNGTSIAARLLLNGNNVEREISALIKTEVSIPATVEH
jgi:hypothetical protein